MTVGRRRRGETRRVGSATGPTVKMRKVIKGWEQVKQRVQAKDRHVLKEEFCIYLEDVPKLIRNLKPDCYFRAMDIVGHGSTDTFFFVGMSSNIIKYTCRDNGRFVVHETLKFPYPLLTLEHVTGYNVFVGMNIDKFLVVLMITRGVTKEVCQLEQLFGVRCITTIHDTCDVVVGGVGFLKVYPMAGIKDRRTTEVQGRDIKTSILKDEWVLDMKVDTFERSLLVLIDSGILILNYKQDWREMHRLSDPEGGTITCCCLDGTNSFLITGSTYGCVKVWSTAIKVIHHQFSGHRDSVKAIACHQKEPVVVSASTDGWVYIWRLDTLRKFKQVKVSNDTITHLKISSHSDPETVGFWCNSENRVYFYELAEPYRNFASMDSTVVKLKRLLGHDIYPNRILVATWDGGVWFKNPVSAETVGFMFPLISLKIVEKYAYDVIRQRLYILLPSGGVVVLSCSKNPFRALENRLSDYPEEAAASILDLYLNVGTEEHSFKTVAILVGMINGQIDLLESDNLHMTKPLQAHHGRVMCLVALTELTSDRSQTCDTTRVLLSAGSDMYIKVWRLRMLAREGVGFELLFTSVLQIRCDKLPKYVSAMNDRVAVVFTGNTTTEMYDIGKTALKPTGEFTPNRTKLIGQDKCLRHSPDYDHTDTVTALDKCPLLKLFATSSMDKTVKIWDDSNTMLRELVFEQPVVDICFFTDIGDLMIARDFVLVFSPAEYYLPYTYLDAMTNRTFEDEKWEPAKKVVESSRAWVDPDRLQKTKRRHSRRTGYAFFQERQLDRSVRVEEWQLSWQKDNLCSQMSSVVVPVNVRRPKRRQKSVVAAELLHPQRYPRLSLAVNIQQGKDEASVIDTPEPRKKSESSMRVMSLVDLSERRKSTWDSGLAALSEEKSSTLGEDTSRELSKSSMCSVSNAPHDGSFETPSTLSVHLGGSTDVPLIQASSLFYDFEYVGMDRDRARSSVGPAAILEDIVKCGWRTQARHSLGRVKLKTKPIRIHIKAPRAAHRMSRRFHDNFFQSRQSDLSSHPPSEAGDQEVSSCPSKFDILRLTAASCDSPSFEEDEDVGLIPEGGSNPISPTPSKQTSQLNVARTSTDSLLRWRISSVSTERSGYGLTPSEECILGDNIFADYCLQPGCGPIGPLRKRPLSPTPCPSVSSSYAESEELNWHRRCMQIPQIPNSVILKTKKHRPPRPLTDGQKLLIKTMTVMDSLYDHRPFIFHCNTINLMTVVNKSYNDRPPIFQKVIVPRPPEEPEVDPLGKKQKRKRRRRKKGPRYYKWDTLEEFAKIRREVLPVFSTRLFGWEWEWQKIATPIGSSSRTGLLAVPDLFAVLKEGNIQQRAKAKRSVCVTRNSAVSDAESGTNMIMHTFMLQCMAEPWFPRDTPRKPLLIYKVLISLLSYMTPVDTLLEICNYIGVLCQEANIPDKLKKYTGTRLVAASTHPNPRVRAGCIRIMPDVAPVSKGILHVLIDSLRSENEELRAEAEVALKRYGIKTQKQLLKYLTRFNVMCGTDPLAESLTLSIAEGKLREKAKEGRGKVEKVEKVLKHYKTLFTSTKTYLQKGIERKKTTAGDEAPLTPLAAMKSLRMPTFLGDPSYGGVHAKPFSGISLARKTTPSESFKGPASAVRLKSGMKDTQAGQQIPVLVVDGEDEGAPRAPPTSPLSVLSELSQEPVPTVIEQSPEGVSVCLNGREEEPGSAEGTALLRKRSSGSSTRIRRPRLSQMLERMVDSLLAPVIPDPGAPHKSESRSSLHFLDSDDSDDADLRDTYLYQLPDRPGRKAPQGLSSRYRYPAARAKKVKPRQTPMEVRTAQKKGSTAPPKEVGPPVTRPRKSKPKPPAYGCLWEPGEPGLRVHHRTMPSVHSPHGPPSTPYGPVTALEGRCGMVTATRQAGQTRYGALSLEWTTRIPTMPFKGVTGKLRQIRLRALMTDCRSCLKEDRPHPPPHPPHPPGMKGQGGGGGGSPPQSLPFPTSLLIACLPRVTKTPKTSEKVSTLKSQRSEQTHKQHVQAASVDE